MAELIWEKTYGGYCGGDGMEIMAVKQILSNCKILYGNDSVTIGLRREEIIRDYFHGEIPEVTVLDSPGNYDLYRSYLEGQSLFAVKTAVVMENPFL